MQVIACIVTSDRASELAMGSMDCIDAIKLKTKRFVLAQCRSGAGLLPISRMVTNPGTSSGTESIGMLCL